MAKKILLIENDPAFASRTSRALEGTGVDVRIAAEGRDGLDLARDWTPDAIVLCVELAGMSGYLVCQKLKKDDALKAIPLVLTSAEATQETFDKHRTLKARADDYLLKPYEPEALLEKLGALVDLRDGPSADMVADDELVSLEEEMGLGGGGGEPEAEIIGLDLQSLPDEPSGDDESHSVDDDLKLLDDAFDGLAAPTVAAKDAAAALDELTGDKPMLADDLEAAAASLPDEDEDGDGSRARAELDALADGADDALGALDGLDETLSRSLKLSEGDSLDVAAPAPASDRRDLGDAELQAAVDGARAELADRDAELSEVRRELEALTRRAGEAEAEARRATEQSRAAQAETAELRRKLADAEQRAAAARQEAAAAAGATAKAEALERESDELRTELLVARGEAEGARNEVEKRTAEVKKRLVELEAANAKNEERVVKAYQKIKADEKIRDKVRKALSIATQLLEEGLPAETPAEKERRAALLGRE
jgi:CheY-like chemotaxis protein/signal transduction histidine kinase